MKINLRIKRLCFIWNEETQEYDTDIEFISSDKPRTRVKPDKRLTEYMPIR